jgi:pyruvate dehydrogenase E1 component alpha subunit
MPGTAVDGNDVLAVREAADEAVRRARKGRGPSLIENKTYRVRGHFEGDPQRYREQAEVQTWQDERDPLTRFTDRLQKKKFLSAKLREQIWGEVESELKAAVTFAEESPFPEPEEALEDLLVNP